MAINPLIPMQGKGIDLGQAATLGINAYQGAQRNAMLQEQQQLQKPLIEAQTLAAQQEAERKKALFQLGDAAVDAIQIKPLLASDPQRAIEAMDARIAKIRERGGDPSDTMALREGLASGQMAPQQVISELDSVIDAAERYGAINQPMQGQQYAPTNLGKLMIERDSLPEGDPRRGAYDRVIAAEGRPAQGPSDTTPAAIREFQYYQSLSPEARAEWDRNKRGDKASTATEKEIFSAADGAQQAAIQYENYSDLAARYEQSPNLASGAAGSISEWLKEQTGSQDAASLLRRDWAAVKASEVVKNLPPGAASDADVKMALAGFLPNNANPKAVASFLRGTAKLAKINGEYQTFKADYLSENKSPAGMLKAWKEYAKTNVSQGSTMSSGNQVAPGQSININGVEIKRVR